MLYVMEKPLGKTTLGNHKNVQFIIPIYMKKMGGPVNVDEYFIFKIPRGVTL